MAEGKVGLVAGIAGSEAGEDGPERRTDDWGACSLSLPLDGKLGAAVRLLLLWGEATRDYEAWLAGHFDRVDHRRGIWKTKPLEGRNQLSKKEAARDEWQAHGLRVHVTCQATKRGVNIMAIDTWHEPSPPWLSNKPWSQREDKNSICKQIFCFFTICAFYID